MTKTECLSQRQRRKYRKAKGTKKMKEIREKVSEKRADQENEGCVRQRQRERWIERLIVRVRATQCSIYIRLPKDT